MLNSKGIVQNEIRISNSFNSLFLNKVDKYARKNPAPSTVIIAVVSQLIEITFFLPIE